jgi:hypothetical protein
MEIYLTISIEVFDYDQSKKKRSDNFMASIDHEKIGSESLRSVLQE